MMKMVVATQQTNSRSPREKRGTYGILSSMIHVPLVGPQETKERHNCG